MKYPYLFQYLQRCEPNVVNSATLCMQVYFTRSGTFKNHGHIHFLNNRQSVPSESTGDLIILFACTFDSGKATSLKLSFIALTAIFDLNIRRRTKLPFICFKCDCNRLQITCKTAHVVFRSIHLVYRLTSCQMTKFVLTECTSARYLTLYAYFYSFRVALTLWDRLLRRSKK